MAASSSQPQPTEPQPIEPQPTEPQPTEPQPIEPQPTEPQPIEPPEEFSRNWCISTREVLSFDVTTPERMGLVSSNWKDATNRSHTVPLGVAATFAPKLWEQNYLGNGIHVAVIDSGIDDRHPDLRGKVVIRKEFLTPDDKKHGTHVAGTIAACGEIYGVAPGAVLHDYTVFGTPNKGFTVETAIVAAIEQAIINGCQIINMSLGGRYPFPPMLKAIRKATEYGILVCVAAGNEGDGDATTSEIAYPAYWNECLSIGAVDHTLATALFSNSNDSIDVCSTGVNVLSTKDGGTGYRVLSGTSMACPTVAGFAALIASTQPRTRYPKGLIRSLVEANVVDIGSIGRDDLTGLGFVRLKTLVSMPVTTLATFSPASLHTIELGWTKGVPDSKAGQRKLKGPFGSWTWIPDGIYFRDTKISLFLDVTVTDDIWRVARTIIQNAALEAVAAAGLASLVTSPATAWPVFVQAFGQSVKRQGQSAIKNAIKIKLRTDKSSLGDWHR